MADIAPRQLLTEQDVIDKLVAEAPELSEIQRARLFTLIDEADIEDHG